MCILLRSVCWRRSTQASWIYVIWVAFIIGIGCLSQMDVSIRMFIKSKSCEPLSTCEETPRTTRRIFSRIPSVVLLGDPVTVSADVLVGALFTPGEEVAVSETCGDMPDNRAGTRKDLRFLSIAKLYRSPGCVDTMFQVK
jgi:hypothetical protein